MTIKSPNKFKRNSSSIPTYIIEEHHEAFIVWNKVISENLIPAKGNILFHFDEHVDFASPSFNQSIHELNHDFDSIKNFTFKELKIDSFIITSIYYGIINQYYWFKFGNDVPYKKHSCFVTSFNNEGLKLMIGMSNNIPKNINHNNFIKFKFNRQPINSIPVNKYVLLDIDLDLFSCTENPKMLNDIHIEITMQEYQNFKNNKYHKIIYSGVSNVEAIEKKGKYYYLLNYFKYIYPIDKKKSLTQISERIIFFVQQLKLKKVQPAVITISRSRYSGYTPEDQWLAIEKMLLDELKTIYDIKIESLYKEI